MAVCPVCQSLIVDDRAPCQRSGCPVLVEDVAGAASGRALKEAVAVDDLGLHQSLDLTAARIRAGSVRFVALLVAGLLLVALGWFAASNREPQGEQADMAEPALEALQADQGSTDRRVERAGLLGPERGEQDGREGLSAPYVDIRNQTGVTLQRAYISHESADSWGEDLLGDSVMRDGEIRRFTLPPLGSSVFDVRVVDADGDSYTFSNVDVSTSDITVTLGDIDTE